ncbi:MAG: ATP-binding cassette domain-containing protein [Nitriliruptorales bacterium]|nr:ATP-binding cassette domain-containing protein [Nitriliruptorales bacterium]
MRATGRSGAPKLSIADLAIDYRIKRTGETLRAVGDVSFDVFAEEFVCIVGPSGCGKSTLLNAIAGLVPYSDGRIALNGQPIAGPGSDRAVVFQAAALLPWRTALDNVAYGIELRGLNKREARQRATRMMELVGLEGSEQRYPHELSGGMQQRVNVARALVADPDLLLLDEPFAALDAQTRENLQDELLRIWERARKTSLFVTHQLDEAVLLADRVVVLSKGPVSTVSGIVPIGFPRPRDRTLRRGSAFIDAIAEIERIMQL